MMGERSLCGAFSEVFARFPGKLVLPGGGGAAGKALFIEDDLNGTGRRLYRTLRHEAVRSGLRVFDLSDVQSPVGQFWGRALDGAPPEGGGMLLAERSLLAARRMSLLLGMVSGGSGCMLSLQHVRRWDKETALFVNVLLKKEGSSTFEGAGAFVVALQDRAEELQGDPLWEALQTLPGVMRFIPEVREAGMGWAGVGQRIQAEDVHPLRLCQLAYLPLSLEEIEGLEGPGAIRSIRKCGVEVTVTDADGVRLVRICDPITPQLGDCSALPRAQLREYHRKLLQVFEARPESPFVIAARFHHAVKAESSESILRWFERGVAAMLSAGKVDEATTLLAEAVVTTAGTDASAWKKMGLRRKLAHVYSMSGRPLQAMITLCGADQKALSGEDWYLLARSACDAGHLGQATEAVERGLNGFRRDEKLLVSLRALTAEIEYLRGNMEASLKICKAYADNPSMMPEDALRLRNVEGKVYLATHQYKKAEEVFKANQEVAGRLGMPRQLVVSMINVAVVRIRMRHYSVARSWLEKALAESRRLRYYREEAICLENLAALEHLKRNYCKALALYRQALEIFQYLGCRELLARVANNMGELHVRFGEAGRAREMLAISKRNCEGIKGSLVEAEGALLEGRLQQLVGNYADAQECFRRAEQLFRAAGAGRMAALATILRSGVLLQQGRIDEASCGLKDASKTAASDTMLGGLLGLWEGRIAVERGEYPLIFLKGALANFRKSGDREGELECLVEMARFMLLKGECVEAEMLLRRARVVNLAIRRTVPAEHLECFDRTAVRRKLATIEEAAGRSGEVGGASSSTAIERVSRRDVTVRAGVSERRSVWSVQQEPLVDLGVVLSRGLGLKELKDRIERQCIEQALIMSEGNISKAAALLGMKRPRLSQLVKHYRLRNWKACMSGEDERRSLKCQPQL